MTSVWRHHAHDTPRGKTGESAFLLFIHEHEFLRDRRNLTSFKCSRYVTMTQWRHLTPPWKDWRIRNRPLHPSTGITKRHGRGLFFCLSRILNQCNVTQKLERASPQKLAQSNLHRKAVSKRFSKVKNFEFEFPTVFRLHNDIFKFSNFENRFFERRIPQRTDQVPWSYSGLA